MSHPEPLDPGPGGRSSTGLDTNVASALCYLLGFISGVVFLVIEKEDSEVRFHAYQSVATFVSIFVLSIALGWVPLVGWLVSTALAPIGLILWIVLMVKAFQGERFSLPVLGEWAQEQVGSGPL